MPVFPPPLVKTTVLMPIAWPRRLISGPPLFPELMFASVWMKRPFGFNSISRSRALTMPTVAV